MTHFNKLHWAFMACFFITFSLYAQDKEELEAKFWKATGEEIIAKTYPTTWENESAIILTDDRYQQYINSGKRVYITSSKHQLLKIQDQSALEGFSEIKLNKDSKVSYLWSTYSKKETIIGIRLIKPDGSIVVVDVEKEEVVEDDIRKIAIPNLEIGDIIDLFIYSESKKKEYDGLEIYPPIESTIKDNYPIVDYKIAIEVENDFFLNMNTYNGAPEVKEEPTERNATRRYVVTAKNLEKIETNRWYYPLVEEPAIKIQVAFAKNFINEKYANIFSGEDGERKAQVSKEDVLDFYNRLFSKVSKKDSKEITKYLAKKGITDVEEQFRKALEYIRFTKNTRYFEPSIAHDAGIIGDYPDPSCSSFYFGRYTSSSNVISMLRSLCMQLDVTYNPLLVQPRYDGPLKDMLIKANARRGIRINTPTPLYFIEYSENMTFDQFPSILENAEVYVGKVVKDRKVTELNLERMPSSTHEDNVYREDIDLALSADKKGYDLDRTYTISGQFKNDYRYDFTSWIEFLDEDYAIFDNYNHYYECGRKKVIKTQTEKFLSLKAERKTQSQEYLKKKAESEWDAKIENYQDTLINNGRYGKNQSFVFKNSFKIKDKYIKKAGPNYILELGKFIGGQIEIEDKERERTSNIYLDYAKTYKYNINFKIPEGYTVQGLDKFNVDVNNDTGSFSVTAVVEDGILKFKTAKSYKKNFLPSKDWDQMLPWLDAALDFNQAKVLLKKG